MIAAELVEKRFGEEALGRLVRSPDDYDRVLGTSEVAFWEMWRSEMRARIERGTK